MSKSSDRYDRSRSSQVKRRRSLLQRRPRPERLETRQLLAANLFHNELMPEDANEDGQVTAVDALTIINELGRQSRGEEQAERGRGRMTDVNNDGQDSPIDALMVINRLNRGQNGGNDGGSNHGIGNERPERPVDEEQSDVVLQWNSLFGEILVANEEDQNPGYASRAMAMLNLAIYDAVTLTSGDAADTFYEYGDDIAVPEGVRTEIAASQAAYTVLSSLYPEQQSMIDGFRDELFGGFRRSPQTGAAVELGTTIGNQILDARANDGSDVIGDYTYNDGIGDFQPDPLNPDVPVWGPAWGEVDTFSIDAAEDFAPQTTPPIDSEQYAISYNEVKELGSVDSTTRTADQTEAGIFWAYDRTGLGTPIALFNDVLETIAVQEGNTLEENAALYAQAAVAMADAGVVAWHTKFSEQFWRPVTAIHDGDIDGNPLTEGDEDWTALGAPDGGDDIIGFTPQFPTYVSGHATFGGALFGAIREFYGTDDISFELASEELEMLLENSELQEAYGLELDDATRSFSSLSEAMAENGRSRVYLGIHFDFDDLVGQEVGQAVASTVSSDFVVASNDDGGPDRDRPRGPRGNGGRGGPMNDGPRGAALAEFARETEDGSIGMADRPSSRMLPTEGDLDLLAQDQFRHHHDRTQNGDDDDEDSDELDLLAEESLA
ncbi:MAG: dockerin type I domain-containing protein [Planctomycetota bacterium]